MIIGVCHNAPMTMAEALVGWFEANARLLPWRTERRDAFRTLVSEIMLQQTQVERVIPRFEAFVERWPDLRALAAASQDEVLGMWSGLGYYRRARMIHRLAREVVDSGRDRLPGDIEGLMELPGIGDYTAAAVGSLAFGIEAPVLDGNVRRVVARVMAFNGDSRTSEAEIRMKSWVSRLFGGHPPGTVNEALMELGATLCVPAEPRCESCPLGPWCGGLKAGNPGEYPAPRKTRSTENLRWVAACFVEADGRWLLRRIQEGPILRGLWLPPLADLRNDLDPVSCVVDLAPEGLEPGRGVALGPVRHHITHRRIEVIPVRIPVKAMELSAAVWQWSRPSEVQGGTSSLLNKLFNIIENNN